MSNARRSLRSLVVLAGLFLSLGAAALLAQDPAGPGDAAIVASKANKVYHTADCVAVKKIAAKSKVTFASATDAAQQKYTPCPICKPAAADGAMDADKADGGMQKTIKGKKAAGKGPAKKVEAAPEGANDAGLKFSRDIAPILAANCVRCHGGAQKKGQFDLSTFDKLMVGAAKEKVILPGKPEESELILRIRNESASGRKMPPGQANLAAETIKTIEDWVKAGARLDAGIDPAATLDSIAPSPEARRKAEIAKLSPQERDKKLEEVAHDRWKKAGAKLPIMTSGKGVVLFGNLPQARADRIVKNLDLQKTALESLLGPSSANALSGPEKISLYVFNDLASYVEFIRTVENREIDAGVENHGKLTVEQPYVAAVDPLAGKDEPAGAASRKSSSKKSGKAKKGAQDDLPDGPDRRLEGLLSESLASSAVTASGKPPKWLISGFGAYFASMVDPPNSNYYHKLREEALAQYRIGWATKAPEALGGEGASRDHPRPRV